MYRSLQYIIVTSCTLVVLTPWTSLQLLPCLAVHGLSVCCHSTSFPTHFPGISNSEHWKSARYEGMNDGSCTIPLQVPLLITMKRQTSNISFSWWCIVMTMESSLPPSLPPSLSPPHPQETSYVLSEEQIEQDELNTHECMLPLMKLLDHMEHNKINPVVPKVSPSVCLSVVYLT